MQPQALHGPAARGQQQPAAQHQKQRRVHVEDDQEDKRPSEHRVRSRSEAGGARCCRRRRRRSPSQRLSSRATPKRAADGRNFTYSERSTRAVAASQPPALGAEAAARRPDRERALTSGMRAPELHQAARHVIARCDDDQPAQIRWLLAQALVSSALPTGVVGVIADVDAAVEQRGAQAALAMQVLAAWPCGLAPEISSRLPAPFRTAGARPRCRRWLAARQHDDAVGRALTVRACNARPRAAKTTKPARNTSNACARGYGDTSACPCHITSPNGRPGVGRPSGAID